MLAYGYRGLDAIIATRTPTHTNIGLDIEPTTAEVLAEVGRPSDTAVVAGASMPRSEHLQRRRDWRDSVARQQRPIDD